MKSNMAGKKKLIFIRHSKAEDQPAGIPDFERSLTTKGKQNSKLMAQLLFSRGEDPGRIITSPAFRALETALIFCRVYGISPGEIRLEPKLYLSLEEDEFLSFIRALNDDDNTVTLFGHNPLLTGMAAFFAADEPEALSKTGIYCLSFDAASWSDVEPESGTTEYYLTLKELA
jgi:phosphohistidine phosphatase